jgi:hypothetical protein
MALCFFDVSSSASGWASASLFLFLGFFADLGVDEGVSTPGDAVLSGTGLDTLGAATSTALAVGCAAGVGGAQRLKSGAGMVKGGCATRACVQGLFDHTPDKDKVGWARNGSFCVRNWNRYRGRKRSDCVGAKAQKFEVQKFGRHFRDSSPTAMTRLHLSSRRRECGRALQQHVAPNTCAIDLPCTHTVTKHESPSLVRRRHAVQYRVCHHLLPRILANIYIQSSSHHTAWSAITSTRSPVWHPRRIRVQVSYGEQEEWRATCTSCPVQVLLHHSPVSRVLT